MSRKGTKHINIHTSIVAISMSFLVTMGSSAQLPVEERISSGFPQPTLGSYLQQAMAENPQLKSFEKRYEAAMHRIPQASALPDPKLQITHFIESVQTRTGPQENLLLLSQQLPWFGKRDRQETAASAEAQALWFAFQTQQLSVAQQVSTSFFEYAYTQKAIQLTEENQKLLDKLEPIVEEKVKSGSDLNTLLRLKVEMGRVNDRLQSLHQQRLVQSSLIRSLLNLPGHSLLPWPEWKVPSPLSLDPSVALHHLETENPELQMLKSNIQSAEARQEIARLKRYPDVMLGVNYIQIGEPVVNPNTPDAGKDPWGITFAVNLPIWSGKNQAYREESIALEQAARNAFDQRLNDLRRNLESSIALLEDANRRFELYGKDLLELAKLAAENSRSSYQNGRTGILEVIDSERSLLDLQLSYWRAAADAWQQQITIQILTNQPVGNE